MKLLFDLFPVILFFAVFKFAGGQPDAAQAFASNYLAFVVADGEITAKQAPILLATAVAILATLGQVLWLLLRRRHVDTMLWVSLVIIVVFGGATIYFHDEMFIKWKPTVLYWCFALALLGAQLLMRKNLIRSLMGQQMSLPDPVWDKLNLAWSAFFAAMGALNLYIAFNFPLELWVNFKMFGFIALMIAFVIGQTVYLSRYLKEPE
ncbi:MAG: septation protein A [Oxalobacteraceae bacterium]|nr:septation protein A [Oxalobacteraceae bacterium]